MYGTLEQMLVEMDDEELEEKSTEAIRILCALKRDKNKTNTLVNIEKQVQIDPNLQVK